MADDTERSMEKLLRASAGKRREESGGPFAMPPATRRMLQGEVKRRFAGARAEGGSRVRPVSWLWPGFAWGSVVCLILASGAWLWIEGRNRNQAKELLTRNLRAVDAASGGAVALPPSSPAPELAARGLAPSAIDSTDRAEAGQWSLESSLGTTTTTAQNDRLLSLASAAGGARVVRDTNSLAAEAENLAGKDVSKESAYKAPTTPVPASTVAAVDSLAPARETAPTVSSSQSQNSVYRFAQTAPKEAILASFRMQQIGRELRIIDGDGSVYKGYVQFDQAAARAPFAGAQVPATASGSPRPASAQKAEIGFSADPSAAQNYFFRVAGTNRSRNQKVVFVGNFMAPGDAAGWIAATNGPSVGGVGGALSVAQVQPGVASLTNSRISGKVTLDAGKEIEINAVQTGR